MGGSPEHARAPTKCTGLDRSAFRAGLGGAHDRTVPAPTLAIPGKPACGATPTVTRTHAMKDSAPMPNEGLSLHMLPWTLFLAASACTWNERLRLASALLVPVALALAWTLGLADYRILLALALLGVANALVRSGGTGPIAAGGHILFVATALALGTHLLPGFLNPVAFGPVTLGQGALPYTLYLNLDKPLVGFWLMSLGYPRRTGPSGTVPWRRLAPWALATAGACAMVAFSFGMMAWAPKWPPGGWIWALNNLLLVATAEEAFFRGYLQEGLARAAAVRDWPPALPILVAAATFGMAHAGGGWHWTVLAGLAGIGYGWAYHVDGLRGSVAMHFGLNLVHFCLLTYPSFVRP